MKITKDEQGQALAVAVVLPLFILGVWFVKTHLGLVGGLLALFFLFTLFGTGAQVVRKILQ